MDAKRKIISTFFILFSILAFSQASPEKTFFDKSGRITSEEQAYYFRQKSDGVDYKCYYVSGESIFFEGKIIHPGDSSESSNVYTGTCIWYFKNGKKKTLRNFNDSGVENGISIYYYESGKLWKEITYANGKIVNNTYKEFEEDGSMNIIFEEDFNDNSNDWDLYTSDKSSAKISNGSLEILSNTSEGTSRFINRSSKTDNYSIEAVINISKTKKEQKTGIIFGYKDWQNYNFFSITQTSFYVGFVYEGISTLLAEDRLSDAINEKDLNTIKIMVRDGKSTFSINGEAQYTAEKMIAYGNNVGFVVGGKSSMSIDKLICKDINLKPILSAASREGFEVRANGAGLLFSRTGLICTNSMVVEDAATIQVEMNVEGVSHSYKAVVLQRDADNDLAILKIKDESFKPLDPLPFSFNESGTVEVGANVFTIGFPSGLRGIGKGTEVTSGRINAKTGPDNAINVYQTSMAVQPGTSGSPLFNEKGQVIGVINSKVSDNISYAVKLNYLKNLIELLHETVELPNNQSLNNLSVEERGKILSEYVVLIKIK